MAKSMGLGKGLGKGLGALLGDEANEVDQPVTAANAASVNEISIDLIDTNPWQPRTEFQQEELDELAQSIQSVGIITPLTVRKMDDGRFQLIAGERRFRAAKQCGLTTVPAYVREVSDDKMLAVALIENIQRSNLNPIEEALSYQRLIDECNLTQETLADQVGKKRSTVTNYLRLLKLPDEIQKGLREKVITMGHARAIMGVEDVETQLMLFRESVEQGYSVRRVEDLVHEYNNPTPVSGDEGDGAQQPETPAKPKRSSANLASEYQELGTQLSRYFSASVQLARSSSGKGKITIPFKDDDDLLRIMELLDASQNS